MIVNVFYALRGTFRENVRPPIKHLLSVLSLRLLPHSLAGKIIDIITFTFTYRDNRNN